MQHASRSSSRTSAQTACNKGPPPKPRPGLHVRCNDLRIDASADGNTSGEFFAGVIQDVAVYDRALEFKDIVSHYWVFATGYPEPEG
jgi:hypothetical protein